MKVSLNTVPCYTNNLGSQNRVSKSSSTNVVQSPANTLNNNYANSNVSFTGWFQDLIDYFPKKLEARRERKREEQFEKIENSIHNDVYMIAKRQNIPYETAKDKYDSTMNAVSIPLSKNGNEQGINKTIGYSYEKYQAIKEMLVPLAVEKTPAASENPVPNGVLVYGPSNTGKTHFVESIGEHAEYKDIADFEEFCIDSKTRKDDPVPLLNFYDAAKAKYEETGKRQILFFDDLDYLIDNDERPTVSNVFLALMKNCKDSGITWIGTANSPKQLPENLFKPTRLNSDIYINRTSGAEKSAVMSYFWKQTGRKDDTNHDRILDKYECSNFHFYPPEMKAVAGNTDKYLAENFDKQSKLHYQKKDKKAVTTDIAEYFIDDYLSSQMVQDSLLNNYQIIAADSYHDYVKEMRGQMKYADKQSK